MLAMPQSSLLDTEIRLVVRAADAETAANEAARALQAMMSRLTRIYPEANSFSVDLEAPEPKDEGSFTVQAIFQAALVEQTSDTIWQWKAAVRAALLQGITEVRASVDKATSFLGNVVDGQHRELGAGVEVEEAEEVELVSIKVTVAGQAHDIEVPLGSNMLDVCIDREIDVKWECKSGVCDTCAVKIHKGQENLSEPTDGEHTMLEDRLQQGYRLSCQVTVKGPVEFSQ